MAYAFSTLVPKIPPPGMSKSPQGPTVNGGANNINLAPNIPFSASRSTPMSTAGSSGLLGGVPSTIAKGIMTGDIEKAAEQNKQAPPVATSFGSNTQSGSSGLVSLGSPPKDKKVLTSSMSSDKGSSGSNNGSVANDSSTYSGAAKNSPIGSGGNATQFPLSSGSQYLPPYQTPQSSSTFSQANSGLLNIGQNGSKDLQDAQDALLKKKMQIANINGVDKGFGTGEQQILQNQLGAYETQVSNALTEQGQQSAAFNEAGALAKPQGNTAYFGSPETGGVVGTGNALIDTNVQQALQMVKSGADVNDPNVTKLLSISPQAQQAFNAAMQNGGSYNPTGQSAQAQQNATQGQNFQQQAAVLDTAIKNADTITPNLLSFLKDSGLNSQNNPSFNSALNTYYGEFLNPGNKAIFDQYIGDIKKFTGQILAANNGSIPTDVSNTLASFDPSNLSAAQLGPYLQNLAKLGHNQLSVLQGQSSSSYGTPGGYAGTPTGTSNQSITAPGNPTSSVTSNNPVIQGLIGGAMNVLGGLEGAITGIASKLLR